MSNAVPPPPPGNFAGRIHSLETKARVSDTEWVELRGPYPIQRDKPPTQGYLGQLLTRNARMWRVVAVVTTFLFGGAGGGIWAVKTYWVSQGVAIREAQLREDRLRALEASNKATEERLNTMDIKAAQREVRISQQEARLLVIEETLRRRTRRDTQDP